MKWARGSRHTATVLRRGDAPIVSEFIDHHRVLVNNLGRVRDCSLQGGVRCAGCLLVMVFHHERQLFHIKVIA